MPPQEQHDKIAASKNAVAIFCKSDDLSNDSIVIPVRKALHSYTSLDARIFSLFRYQRVTKVRRLSWRNAVIYMLNRTRFIITQLTCRQNLLFQSYVQNSRSSSAHNERGNQLFAQSEKKLVNSAFSS